MWLLTLKSLLVATDLDEASRPALRTAARLAPLAEARLHLLHVLEEPKSTNATRLTEHFRAVVPEAGLPDDVQIVRGQPADIIVDYARRMDADAIIVGPHRGLAKDREMGSTAARVVRTAHCPCLVAATELRLPLERVLAPIDLSEIARGSLSVALTWASALRPRGREAQLTALHIATGGDPAEVEKALQEEVELARAEAGGAAHVQIGQRVEFAPDPAAAILEVAARERADLLVLGTRGDATKKSELGSVAAAVARSTPCPLLLVPVA